MTDWKLTVRFVYPLCTLIAVSATHRSRILDDQRLAWARLADGWRHGYDWIALKELQHFLWLGDFRHGGLGNEAATLYNPILKCASKMKRSDCVGKVT